MEAKRKKPRKKKSEKRGNIKKKIEDATITANKMVDTDKFPVGKLTPTDLATAKFILDTFIKYKVVMPEAVNASLKLLERLVDELVHSKDAADHLMWICKPRYFNPLINNWKEAALTTERRQKVFSPRDVAAKIHRMSSELPDFHPSIVPFGMILQVAIMQSDLQAAPLAAEQLLDAFRKEASQAGNSEIKANVYIYSQVMNAWARSGLPETAERLSSLMDNMQNEGVEPSVVTYSILLRFWAGKGAVNRVESILDTMQRKGVRHDAATLNEAVFFFAKEGEMDRAEKYLQEMIEDQDPDQELFIQLVGESVQHILMAYRRAATRKAGTRETRIQALNRASKLAAKVEKSKILDEASIDKLLGTLADIFARFADKMKQAKEIFKRIELPGVEKYSILVRAFGNSDRADLATEALLEVMGDARLAPDATLMNHVIDAWSKSSRADASDQARRVIRLIDEDPRCRQLDIRPDVVTFTSLLKCIVASGSKNAGQKAESVLNEMAERKIRPDVVCLTAAIKSCLVADDLERAEALMDRMEKSESKPNIVTYLEIMNYWAERQSEAGAKRTERILEHLKKLAGSRPQLTPNTRCYNVVMKAWSLSRSAKTAGDRIWAIVNQMENDSVSLSMVSFTTLIGFYAKSTRKEDLARAEKLLARMEGSSCKDIRPDHRHFSFVVNGWVALGEADRAARVFIRRVQSYINDKNVGAAPIPENFYTIAKAWIDTGNLANAYAFLSKMEELYEDGVLPDPPRLRTLRMLRDAWSRSSDHKKHLYLLKLDDMIERRDNR